MSFIRQIMVFNHEGHQSEESWGKKIGDKTARLGGRLALEAKAMG